MGAEFKNKGVSVALGPVVGPLGKLAKGGRNWEGFSNDPYLSGKLTYDTVQVCVEDLLRVGLECLLYVGTREERDVMRQALHR